ncbi:nicotinate-nucleotide--dimethylbenzimidazole phosphoribosyltransferase [Microbulbifer salipaludis]|uniref:Nicotinate-nucleotide--dimethylbenzimidazole phosphoribosyltransferase n=1 Tax=Microbulbifer salipaludis TaxID=187980 RepID=A0ABS3E8C3_9GAMM|nr:nicotinate-nucleotide--dimethylbenzimidazole phosphoribosyltransferase [Microbulbifer salipaludis]MBN8431557.1 nicotinate-nucleotide--dimethylbenzimidazole phosphoribosyltransferase [Microbulbifer salipaludis]
MSQELKWLHEPAPVPDEAARRAALARQAQLIKPPGALGRLETLAVDFAGYQGRAQPQLNHLAVRVFGADHGIAQRGTSRFPQAVTSVMLRMFCEGGAAINVLSREHDADFAAINLGCVVPAHHPDLIDEVIAPSTADFSRESAMTESQLQRALLAGQRQAVECDCFVGGDMGIGNTASAAAMFAALFTLDVADITGRGTGIDDAALKHKIELIESALELHREALHSPLEILRTLGGFEIAALTGAFIASAQRGTPVLVDGFMATAAAAIAVAVNPSVKAWLLFAHRSDESGHQLALECLGVKPLLSLNMRLGEGTGAVLAVSVIKQALALHNSMLTFSEAGIPVED